MEKTVIDQLLKKCSPEDATRISMLWNASIRTLKTYTEAPSAVNLKNWEAAEGKLSRVVTDIQNAAKPNDAMYGNRLAAVAWFKPNGYKIRKSKFYQDCDAGLCAVESDGRVRESALTTYASLYLRKLAEKDGKISSLVDEKLRLECQILKQREAKNTFDMERDRGKYLLKTEVELMLVTRVEYLRAQLEHLAMTSAVDWVTLVSGDTRKAVSWSEMFCAALETMFDEYARAPEIEVTIKKG
jgi:hypothetical protein